MNTQGARCVIVVDRGPDLGPALARAFAADGDRIVLFTDAAGLDAVADAAGVDALPIPPSDRESIQTALARVCARFDGIDVLVCGDKTSPHPQVDILDLDEISWRTSFEANLHAPFFYCQAAATAMKERPNSSGGAIVLLSTSSGRVNLRAPSMRVSPAYEAAAAGLERLARRLAVEWGRYGISVNCVAPGNVDKPGLRRLFATVGREMGVPADMVLAEVTQRQAMTGLVPISAVVRQIVHLTSPASRYVTGQTLLVAAGLDL